MSNMHPKYNAFLISGQQHVVIVQRHDIYLHMGTTYVCLIASPRKKNGLKDLHLDMMIRGTVGSGNYTGLL